MFNFLHRWFAQPRPEHLQQEKERGKKIARKSMTVAEAERRKLRRVIIYIEESTTKDIARALGVLK